MTEPLPLTPQRWGRPFDFPPGFWKRQLPTKYCTALHYAATAGHTRLITWLLEHGADPTLQDDQGQTAMDLARITGNTDAVELLWQQTGG
jgi:hypothetical protein